MRVSLILITIFFITSLFGQDEYYSPHNRDKVNNEHLLKVKWENDVFLQTDRYYTNGVEIEYYTPWLKNIQLTKLLFVPFVNSQPHYSFTLTHHIFTPRNVWGDPNPTDRPYAGYLMFGIKSTHFDNYRKFRWSSELQLGLLGKYSGGELVQNGVHLVLPTSEPIPGWDYQIKNDFCLNYSIALEKELFNDFKESWLELDALGTARVGTPYTDLSGGIRIRAGRNGNYYSPDHLFDKRLKYLYFFSELRFNMMFYDASLQGGYFAINNAHTIKNINTFLTDLNIGFAYKWKGLSLQTGVRMLSPKFQGALSHKWVYFTIGGAF